MNNVTLTGRLTKDPELKYIPESGTPVANFTLAVNRDFTKKDGTREADFIPVQVMGKPAEFCANYLTKGRLIACNGRVRVNNYQAQDGSRRTYTFVNARNVEALESKKMIEEQNNNSNADGPSFSPGGHTPDLDPNAFGAVDDEDLPF